MRATASGELGETERGGFAAGPGVSEGAQGIVKGADAAAQVEDIGSGRKIVGEQSDAFGVGGLCGAARRIEVCAMEEPGLVRIAEIAVRGGGVVVGVQADRNGGEFQVRAIGQVDAKFDVREVCANRIGETGKKAEAGGDGYRKTECSRNVGAGKQVRRRAELLLVGVGGDVMDGVLGGTEVNPAFDRNALAVKGSAKSRRVDVESRIRRGERFVHRGSFHSLVLVATVKSARRCSPLRGRDALF